jgi:hypothetical protein
VAPRQVVLAYTRLQDEVVAALDATGIPYDRVDVSGDDQAYWRLIAERWEAGQDWCLVEHDIVVKPGQIEGMLACREGWCGHTYGYYGLAGVVAGLGLVKFSGDLMRRHPDLLRRIGDWRDPGHFWDMDHPPGHWCRLDLWLQQTLLPALDETRHDHGTAIHLRSAEEMGLPAHGCQVLHALVITSEGPWHPVFGGQLLNSPKPHRGLAVAVAVQPPGSPQANGDAVAESIRRSLKTPGWKRLLLWHADCLPRQLDAVMIHAEHTAPFVCSVGPDGQPCLGMVSMSRELLERWPVGDFQVFGEQHARPSQRLYTQLRILGHLPAAETDVQVGWLRPQGDSRIVLPNREMRRHPVGH